MLGQIQDAISSLWRERLTQRTQPPQDKTFSYTLYKNTLKEPFWMPLYAK